MLIRYHFLNKNKNFFSAHFEKISIFIDNSVIQIFELYFPKSSVSNKSVLDYTDKKMKKKLQFLNVGTNWYQGYSLKYCTVNIN